MIDVSWGPKYWNFAVPQVREQRVAVTPAGALLAMWTASSIEGSADTRVAFARSEDGGRTWSPAQVMVGATGEGGTAAMFGFPVVSRTGRIWCFYNRDKHLYDMGFRVTAALACHYSDDDGRTWTDGGIEVGYGRTRFDHPDPRVPCNCIVWQKPIRDSRGRPLVTFTRGSSLEVFPASAPTSWGVRYYDGQGGLLRFDNIDDGPDPGQVRLTFLPEEEGALRCPMSVEPERSRGYSCFHEPSAVLLPDGRVFLSASSVSGHLLYSVSQDPDGRRWQRPQPLCYRDGGRPLLHPIAPAPLYALADGRFLIFHHNHDGTRHGGLSPRDMRGRRPTCYSVGAYREGAVQPIWFGEPRVLCDTQGVGIGPGELVWLANYASLTEQEDRRVFWYPDRKHFLLGRYITDEMLAEAPAPR
ncbi:MAG: sialidase family protein [Candidatus Latescibacterota bacterium]